MSRAFIDSERLRRAGQTEGRMVETAKSAVEIGTEQASEFLRRVQEKAADKVPVPPLRSRKELLSDRFSEQFPHGGGIEGVRLAITEEQFDSIRKAFDATVRVIRLMNYPVRDIRFEHGGNFRILLGNRGELASGSGAQLRVEYVQGEREAAIVVLELIKDSLDVALGWEKKQEKGMGEA